MKKVTLDNVLDMLGTIKRLRARQEREPDPRVRTDIAQTLDMLDSSLDSILDKYTQALEQERASESLNKSA